MLLKACAKCGVLIPYGRKWCDKCTSSIENDNFLGRGRSSRLEAQKKYNKTRDPKYSQFYNSKAWRTLSRKRIQDDGYKCVKCGKIASEVDHIIPIQTPDGWERRFDFDNLQSLCVRCHNLKHGRMVPRSSRPKK